MTVARKLAFQSEQSREYAERVADLKEKFITNQHLEIIEGPKALKDKGREKVWNDVVAAFVTEEPRFDRTRFANKREMINAANKLLRGQVKKIRLRPSVSGTLGPKCARDDLNEPWTGQAMVPLDPSKLPSPDFAIVLRGDSSQRFVSTFSLLANIDDFQNWVCTKLGFPIGSAQIEVVLPVKDEQIFGITDSGVVHLDVSDQISWNSVICMAQKVTAEPTKFLTILVEAKRSTVEERQRRWSRPKPAEDGPDPKRAKIDSDHGGDLGTDLGLNLARASDLVIRTEHNDLGQTNEGYVSEASNEEDDPVVTADDMQGIICSFRQDVVKGPSVDVGLFDEDGGVDRSDPRHKEELNPGGLGGHASNSNENEFFGLYAHRCFGFRVLYATDLF